MSGALEDLIEKALQITMTAEQARKQRLSFAYGNTHFENARITREMVEKADDHLANGARLDVPSKGK